MGDITNRIENIANILATDTNKINNLPNYLDTSDATAKVTDLVTGVTAYVNDVKITGTVTNSVSGLEFITNVNVIDNSKSNTIMVNGYHTFENYPVYMAQGRNLMGHMEIPYANITSIANITPNVIKNGVNILGVMGNLSEGIDTSDATATASDILVGMTAYVNGVKLNGTIQSTSLWNIDADEIITYDNLSKLQVKGTAPASYFINTNSDLRQIMPYSMITNAIGLTPNILKNGVTILDVTGTLESGENLTNIIVEQSNIISNLENIVNTKSAGGGTSNTVLPDGIKFSGSECSQLPNFDTSQITNMYEMFAFCSNITSVPNYNTSNVTRMGYTFEQCFNLVDIPQFNTSNVTYMTSTFEACNNLSNASVQNIINMCLNSNVNVSQRNLSNIYPHSPLFNTKFDNSYYSNRLTDLTNAGWSY